MLQTFVVPFMVVTPAPPKPPATLTDAASTPGHPRTHKRAGHGRHGQSCCALHADTLHQVLTLQLQLVLLQLTWSFQSLAPSACVFLRLAIGMNLQVKTA